MQSDAPSTASTVKCSVASSSISSSTPNHGSRDVMMRSRSSLLTSRLLWYRYGTFVSVMALLVLGAGHETALDGRALELDYYDAGCLQPNATLPRYVTDTKGDLWQDLYDFGCGAWQRESPGVANQLKALQQRVTAAAVESLVLEDGSAAGPSHQEVSWLYQRCAQLAFNEQNRLADLHRILGRFNLSWPTSHPRSKLEAPDVLVSLSPGWNVTMPFRLSAGAHFKRPGLCTPHFASLLYTFECFLTSNALEERGTLLAYFERASVILNGSTVPKRMIEEATMSMHRQCKVLKMFNYVLTVVVPSLMDPRPATELVYVVVDQEYITGPYLFAAEWLMVVDRRLSVACGRDDEMFVLNVRFLRLVAVLVGNVEDTTGLLACVTWLEARHLGPMTSYPPTRPQFMDGRDAKRVLGYMTSRCYTDADAALPIAFAHVLSRRLLPVSPVRNATAILGRLRSVANATVTFPWIEPETRRGAPKKRVTLGAIVADLDLESGHKEALRQLYPSVPELIGSYLDMALALHATKVNFSDGLVRLNGSTSLEVGVPLTVVNAFYNLVYHVRVTPAAIMYPPYYVAGYPPSYIFAILGHGVGPEITHALHPEEALFGLRRNWWTSASRKMLACQLACLRRLHNQHPWTGAVRYGDHALLQHFAENGGLLKAYRANREIVVLQHSGAALGTSFTDGQLFFASSCFMLSSNDDQGLVVYSPPRARCNGPRMNMSEFAQSFNCTLGYPMNRNSRCGAMCQCTFWDRILRL